MERALEGLAAAPGTALGRARIVGFTVVLDREPISPRRRPGEVAAAGQALDRAATEIDEIATRLRRSGRDEEAEIIETGALIARDPSLRKDVASAVFESGVPAAAAILDAAEAQARLLAALDDTRLAERADDIRSVGRRAAGLADMGSPRSEDKDGATGEVLIAPDLGPAEVAELDRGVLGIALADGGVSAHAAIVARSLGIPMVVGVGQALLTATTGAAVVIDGSEGTVFLSPNAARAEAARLELGREAARRARALATRELPAVTVDGHAVRVLANVSGVAELKPALEAGAEGVGLLRTELAFLAAPEWPSEDDHRGALAPVLSRLPERVATVRVLDFGGDKTPPFLAGVKARGIELLLEHPDHFSAQLRAILASAGRCDLRVLLPMVATVEQVAAARRAVLRAVDAVGGAGPPPIGAMIETSAGVDAARAIAEEVDFVSIGTNDLTHSTLDTDRFSPQAARTHDPRVLRVIARVVEAARLAGVPIEICGEAASDPVAAPLLIGSGVDEVSVAAARVGTVRTWVRSLDFAELRRLEAGARELDTTESVESLVAPVAERLALLERADADAEVLERPVGVVTPGAEPQGRASPGA